MAIFAIFVFVSLSLFDFANAFDKEDDIESIFQSLHNTKLATPPTPRPITAEMMPEPRPSTAEMMRENKTIVEERVLANMDPSPVSNNNSFDDEEDNSDNDAESEASSDDEEKESFLRKSIESFKKLVVQLEEAEGEKLIEKLSWASETESFDGG